LTSAGQRAPLTTAIPASISEDVHQVTVTVNIGQHEAGQPQQPRKLKRSSFVPNVQSEEEHTDQNNFRNMKTPCTFFARA